MLGKSRTYLDYAAAAPVTASARNALLRALPIYGNPSSTHEEGRKAGVLLEEARQRIARLAGARPSDVTFVPGATEGNALSIEGHIAARCREGARPSDLSLLYLPGAHASLLEAVRRVEEKGVRAVPVPLAGGAIDLPALSALITDDTALVSLEAVCPETGARYDTLAVRRLLDAARKDRKGKIALHVDASQLPLIESFERTRLGADLLILDAQKVGGVRGIGVLVHDASVPLSPLYGGGGQERGLSSGTKSPALAIAFAVALEEAARGRAAFSRRAGNMRALLLGNVRSEIPDALVNEGKENAPHILNLSFPGRDTDYLAALLDQAGFSVSTRSACDAASDEGSRAVQALYQDAARAKATLRISWGPATQERALLAFSRALSEAVSFLDRTRL